MKTVMYVIAILALGGQAMLIGQTVPTIVSDHNDYFIRGTWKKTNHPVVKRTEQQSPKVIETQIINTLEAKEIATINSKIDNYNKQYVELQKTKSEINNQINTFFIVQDGTETSTSNTLKENASIQQQLAAVLNDIEALKLKSKRSKELAKTNGDLKQAFAQSSKYDAECVLKQILASELSLKLFYEKYNFNKLTVYSLIRHFNDKSDVLSLINTYLMESDRYLQLAKEMREEAYAQATNGAKLGELTNAEEKEILALNKQEKAIELLNENQVFKFRIKSETELLCMVD